ncbi:hypothetical protein MBLNU457_5553t1 [Dothideomycetes sp. NU457]
MPLLQRLSDTFWGFLSPSATKVHTAKRKRMSDVNMDSPVESDARSLTGEQQYSLNNGSLSELLQRQTSLSPNSKMRFWRLASPEHSTISPVPRLGEKRKIDSFENATVEKRVGKSRKTVMYSWGQKSKMAEFDDEAREAVDLEGDTLMDTEGGHEGDMQDEATALPSREWEQMDEGETTLNNQYDESFSNDEFEDAVDEDDEQDELQNNESTVKAALNVLPPSPTQLFDLSDTWASDIQPLYLHIKNRGREPLLPRSWNLDFKYLPDGLFLPKQVSSSLAPIRALNQSYQTNFSADFRAKRALQRLFDMPGRARDKMIANLSPETLVCRHVEESLSWALLDAGLGPKTLGLVVVQTSKGIQNYAELETVLRRKLAAQAKKWRAAFLSSVAAGRVSPSTGQSLPMPSMYAVVVSRATVAVMAYTSPSLTINSHLHDDISTDADDQVAGHRVEVRNMVMFDLSLAAYDVWNAFTLAILACHVRGKLCEIVKGGVDAGQNIGIKSGEKDDDF